MGLNGPLLAAVKPPCGASYKPGRGEEIANERHDGTIEQVIRK